MRQWELVGITDGGPGWSPDIVLGEAFTEDTSGRFFWSTDVALTFRLVSEAAGEAIGMDPVRCEGRDLLAVFGIEGTNLAILEAHTDALQGSEGRFILSHAGRRVRCRVAPTHAGDGRVIGTFCLAVEDDPNETATRALATAAA
jgi:hypothetical protein